MLGRVGERNPDPRDLRAVARDRLLDLHVRDRRQRTQAPGITPAFTFRRSTRTVSGSGWLVT
jgi:hypothetical protein